MQRADLQQHSCRRNSNTEPYFHLPKFTLHGTYQSTREVAELFGSDSRQSSAPAVVYLGSPRGWSSCWRTARVYFHSYPPKIRPRISSITCTIQLDAFVLRNFLMLLICLGLSFQFVAAYMTPCLIEPSKFVFSSQMGARLALSQSGRVTESPSLQKCTAVV